MHGNAGNMRRLHIAFIHHKRRPQFMIMSGCPVNALLPAQKSCDHVKHRGPSMATCMSADTLSAAIGLCSGTVKIVVIHSVPNTANRMVLTMNLYW